MAGAERVVVRVTPVHGSMGAPILVGIKDGQEIWQHAFPRAGEVNVAKFEAECGRQVIQLSFQYPSDNAWIAQRFTWNGVSLRWQRDLNIGGYKPLNR
ncbi:hypothetical protein MAFF211271_40540 (plasmid) [Ralstonia syzygii subsp. indonesiensis]|nr:hypothetical protein CJO97_20630 [Ralstonia solanacearum]BEU74499.1 hypothetical protein MAFF211271_40540 [Ralstonia pseudosolanacearum]